jgi:anaerobic magnesium-protoporphyrin IX monomethyl ester cyclase
MNVLLLNPPSKNYYEQLGMNLMPLGLAYLTSVLRQNGHNISVIDLQSDYTFNQDIPYQNFDIVGISTDTPRFNIALSLGQQIRNKGIPVIFGGPHTTFLDREPIEKLAADFIVRGEGEYTTCKLLDALEHNNGIEHIRGITYRVNGTIRHNPDNPLIENLDLLPLPARDIFHPDRYLSSFDNRSMATVLTSRGCPYDCFFCAASRIAGKKWRTRSLDSIFNELEHLINMGYGSFIFVDDNFTLNYRRIMDFCEEVIHRKWDIKWWCFSRVDTIVRHPDMVKKMAETGNRSAFLGLESGNQNTLNFYQKKTSVQQQRDAVSILKKNGVRVFGSFILGEFHETKRMINHTIRYAKKLNPDKCQFSLLTPYPGSELYLQLDRNNKLVTKNWQVYDGAHMVFETEYLSIPKLEKLFRKAYFRFYVRLSKLPAALWQFLTNPAKVLKDLSRIFYGLSLFKDLHNKKSSELNYIIKEDQDVSIQWK